MRFTIAFLILGLALPTADAGGSKAACRNRCDSMYQFCLNRSTTKAARKSCKADFKNCKGQCNPPSPPKAR